jgi:hypothetical protein
MVTRYLLIITVYHRICLLLLVVAYSGLPRNSLLWIWLTNILEELNTPVSKAALF